VASGGDPFVVFAAPDLREVRAILAAADRGRFMKLVTCAWQGHSGAGLWLEQGVIDLASAGTRHGVRSDLSSVLAIIQGSEASLRELSAIQWDERDFIPHQEVKLLAPLPNPPRNVFCIGRNYLDHVREGDSARGVETKPPEWPQIFTKTPQTINGPDAAVPYFTGVTSKLDYEVELAVIIGKQGRDIPKHATYDHIFGYTICNDVTARDVQRRHEQWFKGKSLDGSLPMGPWIVTSDEIGDPSSLELSLTLNGELRQAANTGMMIFDIPTIVAQLSAGMSLMPGDIIATGTPSGVGYAMNPPGLLGPGDVVVCTIDRIGSLRNQIVDASQLG
jgi:2-keto-4-pentenoate hydratase/2-oxohepta-3-ene-1,7-dioic acid hydratase in catechol pathway